MRQKVKGCLRRIGRFCLSFLSVVIITCAGIAVSEILFGEQVVYRCANSNGFY